LQPIRATAFDGSNPFLLNILLVPQAIGGRTLLVPWTGEGPRLQHITTDADFAKIKWAQTTSTNISPRSTRLLRILSRRFA